MQVVTAKYATTTVVWTLAKMQVVKAKYPPLLNLMVTAKHADSQ